jgi:hypothetical protein
MGRSASLLRAYSDMSAVVNGATATQRRKSRFRTLSR